MTNKSEVASSSTAFQFLKDVMRAVDNLVPELSHDHDWISSIQGQTGHSLQAMVDEGSADAASTASAPSFGANNASSAPTG